VSEQPAPATPVQTEVVPVAGAESTMTPPADAPTAVVGELGSVEETVAEAAPEVEETEQEEHHAIQWNDEHTVKVEYKEVTSTEFMHNHMALGADGWAFCFHTKEVMPSIDPDKIRIVMMRPSRDRLMEAHTGFSPPRPKSGAPRQ
jgi:hypothetical protein